MAKEIEMSDKEILAWLVEHREWMGQPVREGYNAIIDALRARIRESFEQFK
jgi:hypothetical protein